MHKWRRGCRAFSEVSSLIEKFTVAAFLSLGHIGGSHGHVLTGSNKLLHCLSIFVPKTPEKIFFTSRSKIFAVK